jgi:hypothetical protein
MHDANDDELYTLRNQARPLGFWVGIHEQFDPCRGGGPYYLMRRKEHKDQRNPSLLRYATKEMIEDYLEGIANDYAA